jgi:hypothetical protein
MKILALLFLFGASAFSVKAQKYDYTWLSGYSGAAPIDSGCLCTFGSTKLDFNSSRLSIIKDTIAISFSSTNNPISDSTGNLWFYSNGTAVADRENEIIQNSDSLGWGPFFTSDPDVLYDGMLYPEYLLTLPNPKRDNLFDLFYFYFDSANADDPNELLRATVDMDANNGRGLVTQKDVEILGGHEMDVAMSAVQDADGHDWWLCISRAGTNCYDVIYYNGTDSFITTEQCGGAIEPAGDLHGCRFSPDGKSYVSTTDSGDVNIFNFNRCTGQLSFKEHFIVSEVADSSQWWMTGAEFSADSRFLYLFCAHRIFQYDMAASPIASSKDTIAVFQGFYAPFPIDYSWGQRAPDGKIYINTNDGGYYISVIDSPEGKGAACNFKDHGIELPSYIIGLPYYPNYRLGALSTAGCDSLAGINSTGSIDQEQQLKIYPNPAEDYTIIDYGFTDWSKGPVRLEVINSLGQTVYQRMLPMYSGFQKLDVSKYASGIYEAFIRRQGSVVSQAQFVKE